MAGLTAGDISLRYSIILGGISRGISGNAIISELTAAGLGARRSTLLQLISDARSFYASQESTAGLDYFNPVPQENITPWASKTMTGYGHIVKLITRDIGTGQPGERWYTAVSSSPMTPAAAIQQAMDANAGKAQDYEYTFQGAALTNVVQYQQLVI